MVKKKIIVFANSYLPSLGGIQTVCSQLSAGLKERDYDVYVFTNKNPFSLPFNENIDGIIIKRFILGNLFNEIRNIKTLINCLLSILIFPFTLVHILVYIYRIRPDIINIHFPLAQLPYIKLARVLFCFKIVTSFHGHDVLRWQEENKRRLLFQLQKSIIRSSSEVTACSDYLSRKVESTLNLPVYSVKTVYNGVDLRRFDNIGSTKSTKEYIFSFGRLEDHKGFDMLIGAFSRIKNQDLHLFIAGEGSQLDELQNQAKQLSVLERITFLGRITPEQIVSYSSQARVNIISSRREPFGIVVLEAIASKRPVLATKVGGIPEILDERFGVLVEANEDGLLEGLDYILNKSVPYFSLQVDEYLKDFSVDSMVSNYIKSYL